MEKKRNESEGSYWFTAHSGFDFDEGELQWQATTTDSKLSTLMRKDELNQFDLLQCDGLTEVAENRSASFFPFSTSQLEDEKYVSELAKNCNPLIINQKKKTGSIRCEPEETIKNMILGSEYSLSRFKGKKEKIALLDAAVRSHDGNAILQVILFLRDTLKKSIFQREIVAYPDAVNVYLAYLEEDHESDEHSNMLLLLDRAEEAAILKYEAAVKVQHPERKLKLIENCFSTHFQLGVTDTFLRQSVEDHIAILEEQIELEKYNQVHSIYGNKNALLFEKLTGKISMVDSSVLCSLIFCCLNFSNSFESPDNNLTNPEKMKTFYNLSKKQYTWAMLRALAAVQRWPSIDDLFIVKSWLGGTKIRSCIAYSRILEVLFKAKAPNATLTKYVSCIENENEKLMLAKKYACHSIIIESYKNNKDRAGLIQYKATLLPHSVDFCNATEILRNPMIRWKN